MPLFGPPNVIKLKEKRDVKKLIEALKYKDASVRKLSAYVLGELGDPRAVEPLCAALKDEYKSVRASSASALGKIGNSRAIEPLCAALKDEDNSVRGSSSGALVEIGEPAVDSLIAALRDDNKNSRGSSLYALIKIGEPAVKPLCAALNDDIHHVRWLSAEALGKISDASAVEPLCTALKDEDKVVRVTAASALGRIGDPRAVDPLRDALEDDDEDVRKKSADALNRLGVQPKEFESQQKKPHEKSGKAKSGLVAQSEELIELFNRRKIDPAGKKILAFAMLYEFERTAPAVWVSPGPDPLAAPDEGPEVRQTRFLASKIVPGYQPHFIPGHLTVDLDTAVVSRQFKQRERLDAAYINQVLAVMLAPLVTDQDLGHCSALSLSGESHALGQTRFAIVVGGAPNKAGVKLLRQYTKPIIPGVLGTYFEYEAASLEEARVFLSTQTITEQRFYIEVHTPKGAVGKDLEGVYEFDG